MRHMLLILQFAAPDLAFVRQSSSVSFIIQSSLTLFWIPRVPISLQNIIHPA